MARCKVAMALLLASCLFSCAVCIAEPEPNPLAHESTAKIKGMAAKGDLAAQTELADRLLRGIDTKTDIHSGLTLMRKLANQNYAPAISHLADLYDDGAFVPEDQNEAIRLYAKAAKQHYGPAEYKLGLLNMLDNKDGGLGNFSKGLQLCMDAANHGSVQSAYFLGETYRKGNARTPRDDKKALQWFLQGAKLGSRNSEIEVATAYFNGTGVSKDMRMAITYFAKHDPTAEGKRWRERVANKRALSQREIEEGATWMRAASREELKSRSHGWSLLHAPVH